MNDTHTGNELLPITSSLSELGEIANHAALRHILEEYLDGLSLETRRRQRVDIHAFEKYLADAGHSVTGMEERLDLWRGITYGLVKGFRQWMKQHGYSIGTMNVRMSTIKQYCEMAFLAEYVSTNEITRIRKIQNISKKAGRNIDEQRATSRVGLKKASTVLLSESHVALIKKHLHEQSNDPEIARDYLLFCLMTDHGLRCGEVAELERNNLDTLTGMLVFYRRKVNKTQTHHLTPDTLEAAHCYLRHKSPAKRLFEGQVRAEMITKSGKQQKARTKESGLTTRAISKIINRIGKIVDVEGLSPHDLRHYWATIALRKGTDIKALQQAGGWNSPYMPLRYAEESEIANKGVKLQ